MFTVTASFNTAVRQMTEMFQWPKISQQKNDQNVSAKKTGTLYLHVQYSTLEFCSCDIITDRSLAIYQYIFQSIPVEDKLATPDRCRIYVTLPNVGGAMYIF